MDRLIQLKVFSEVASRGNFTRAATALELSKASISKGIAQLEERVGVRLLNRSTRSVSLTDAGRLLADRLGALFNIVDNARAELAELAVHPSGRLRLAAPHGLTLNVLEKSIGDFIATYPDVHVSLHLSNRVVDLVEQGIDVALRIGPIEDQNLIVRRLRPIPFVLCASPKYWAKNGIPAHPDELRSHDVLTYSLWDGPPQLPFFMDGQAHYVPVRSRMDADDAAPLLAMAVKGLGVTFVPEFLAQAYLARGALVPVLSEFMPPATWLCAAYPHRNHKSAALRALLDFLGPVSLAASQE